MEPSKCQKKQGEYLSLEIYIYIYITRVHHVQGTHWISISKYDRFNYARVWERETSYRCYPSPCQWFVSPVHLCGCLGPRARSLEYVNARLCESTQQTCTRRGAHRYGVVANGEIQPATETVIPSLYRLSLPSIGNVFAPRSPTVVLAFSLFRVYLMRIEGVKPSQGQFETFSARSRGNLGKEAVSWSKDPSPGSRSTYLGWRDQL